MRISFLDDEPEIYPNQYGGKARTIVNLARHLSVHPDVERVSILSRSINSSETEFTRENIRFKRLEGYSTVTAILEEASSVDILNVHTCSFTMPYLRGFKAAIVNHLHDVIFATVDAGSHLDKALGNNWSAILAPSQFARRTLLNVGWWAGLEPKVHVISRGVDKEKFFRTERGRALEFISRDNPGLSQSIEGAYPVLFFPHRVGVGKGDSLLGGLHDLLMSDYENPLILVTSESPEHPIHGVEYIGWVPTDNLRYFYSLSDVTLALSLLPESFSQVPLESLACGTPVVAFRFGNLACLIDEFPSIHGSYPDASSVYEATSEILENPNKSAKEISESGEIVHCKYSITRIVQELLKTYQGLPKNFELDEPSQFVPDHESGRAYFVSPTIAQYGRTIFVVDKSGMPERHDMDKMELEIVKACQQAATHAEVHKTFNASPSEEIDSRLARLVKKQILVS